MAEQQSVDQRIPDKIPEWLAHLAAKANPHKAPEQFQKLHPPAFKGATDPMQAEEWLHQIEKILDIIECMKNQRVAFITFMFQGEEEHWWEMIKGGVKSAGKELT